VTGGALALTWSSRLKQSREVAWTHLAVLRKNLAPASLSGGIRHIRAVRAYHGGTLVPRDDIRALRFGRRHVHA
jgi:hypothetical protein